MTAFLALLAQVASAAPNVRFTGVTLTYHRQGIAVIDGSGWCALRVDEQWVSFSADSHRQEGRELDGGLALRLATPLAPDTARGVSATLTVALDAGGSAEWTLALPEAGVPVQLTAFADAVCDLQSEGDVAALARVRELPRPARTYVVELLSIAALASYPPSSAPSASDTPLTQIPLYAAQCTKGRQCDLWATSVARGLTGPRSPTRPWSEE